MSVGAYHFSYSSKAARFSSSSSSSSSSLVGTLAPLASCGQSIFLDEDCENTNSRLQEEERQVRLVYEEGLRLKKKSRELQSLVADTEERRQIDRQEYDAILQDRDALIEHLRTKHAFDLQEVHDLKASEFQDILRQLVESRNTCHRSLHDADELHKWVRTLEQDQARQQAFFQQTVKDMADTHCSEIAEISRHVGREQAAEREVLLSRALRAEAAAARLAAMEEQQATMRVPAVDTGDSGCDLPPPLTPSPRSPLGVASSLTSHRVAPSPPRPEFYSPFPRAALMAAQLEIVALEGAVAAKEVESEELRGKLSALAVTNTAQGAEIRALQSQLAEMQVKIDSADVLARQLREENGRMGMHIRILAESRSRDRPFASYTASSTTPTGVLSTPAMPSYSLAASREGFTSSSEEPSPLADAWIRVVSSPRGEAVEGGFGAGSGSVMGYAAWSTGSVPGAPPHPAMLSPLRTRAATLCCSPKASRSASRSASQHAISTAPPPPVSGGVSRAPSLNSQKGVKGVVSSATIQF